MIRQKQISKSFSIKSLFKAEAMFTAALICSPIHPAANAAQASESSSSQYTEIFSTHLRPTNMPLCRGATPIRVPIKWKGTYTFTSVPQPNSNRKKFRKRTISYSYFNFSMTIGDNGIENAHHGKHRAYTSAFDQKVDGSKLLKLIRDYTLTNELAKSHNATLCYIPKINGQELSLEILFRKNTRPLFGIYVKQFLRVNFENSNGDSAVATLGMNTGNGPTVGGKTLPLGGTLGRTMSKQIVTRVNQ